MQPQRAQCYPWAEQDQAQLQAWHSTRPLLLAPMRERTRVSRPHFHTEHQIISFKLDSELIGLHSINQREKAALGGSFKQLCQILFRGFCLRSELRALRGSRCYPHCTPGVAIRGCGAPAQTRRPLPLKASAPKTSHTTSPLPHRAPHTELSVPVTARSAPPSFRAPSPPHAGRGPFKPHGGAAALYRELHFLFRPARCMLGAVVRADVSEGLHLPRCPAATPASNGGGLHLP